VGLVLVVLDIVLRAYLSRPFWYDEIWRGHYVSEPVATFWPELSKANTPSALGWVVMERLGGQLLGWHTWVLRLPGFLALPLLGAGITLLVSRFTSRPVAAFAALWICLDATQLDLATQLKPYTLETLAAVVAVLLWLRGEGTVQETPRRGVVPRRLTYRTLAGVVSLFSVPAVFVIGPLALAGVLLRTAHARRASRGDGGGLRQLLPAAAAPVAEALPAVLLTAANTLFFVAHQSSQRLGHYWDAQFLAGRSFAGAITFVGRELRDVVTGTPPGIDRYDPSLLHAPTDGTWASVWLLAPAVVVCGLVGVMVLARRHDGRILLITLAGAQLGMLAASADRYWPFGPTRTNLFVVPLVVLVVVGGADTIVRRAVPAAVSAVQAPVPSAMQPELAADAGAIPTQVGGTPDARVGSLRRRGRAAGVATVAIVLVAAVPAAGMAAGASSVARDGRLYAQRDRLRGLDLTIDAALATRRLYRRGDLVVVGGRLMRAGWIYAMEASADGPRRPDLLPALPAGTGVEPPRVPRSDTVFFSVLGQGQVAAEVAARRPAPNRLLVFVFDPDTAATRPDFADLRRAGWCTTTGYPFPQTGTLTVLTRCARSAGSGR
jgi:hypothetical protein